MVIFRLHNAKSPKATLAESYFLTIRNGESISMLREDHSKVGQTASTNTESRFQRKNVISCRPRGASKPQPKSTD